LIDVSMMPGAGILGKDFGGCCDSRVK
jgi:hypothetical protein